MNNYYIYLAGGMDGLSREEMGGWRWTVEKKVRDHDWSGSYTMNPVFFNPVVSYNPCDEGLHKSEREPFEYDLDKLRNSNLVVVNFNSPKSIGTAMELAVARENRIPIIGLNESGYELHPWLEECCTRMCDTMEELCDHIALYYLNW